MGQHAPVGQQCVPAGVEALGTECPARPVLPTLSDFYPDAVECLRAVRVFCSAVTGQDV